MNLEFLFDQGLVLALIFLRIATALALMPLFGYRGLPLPIKVGLAAFLSLLLLPLVQLPADWNLRQTGLLSFIGLAIPEIITGLLIGMVSNFIFYGVELAGQFLGIQMGFSIAQVMDPSMEEQVSIISQLQYLFATLIFLTFNGHHFLLEGLQQTFQAIPLGGVHLPSGIFALFVKLSGEIFVAAIKIAAPVMAALLISEVALGIIARTVPQMNIFLVGFPLKIGIGLIGLALTLPMFAYILEVLWKNFQGDWRQFIGLLGP